MLALNFYHDLYGEALKKGRKSATIRLGDKSAKYQTGQIVWVTVGQRFARRKKLFTAIIDAVEVKTLGELSPRDVQRETRNSAPKKKLSPSWAKSTPATSRKRTLRPLFTFPRWTSTTCKKTAPPAPQVWGEETK